MASKIFQGLRVRISNTANCFYAKPLNMCSRNLSTSLPDGEDRRCDVVVVGGGIVGAATARELLIRHPHLSITLLEKEDTIAPHQSGHNSGVLHAGIYYTPGSLKARLCVEGIRLAYEYCDKHDVPYNRCGKLIVASNEEEVPRLDELWRRGLENNVPDIRLLTSLRQIQEVEPNVVGVKAIHSPYTGIVDWGEVTRSYSRDFQDRGGRVIMGFEVSGFEEVKEGGGADGLSHPVSVHSKTKGSVECRHVITCGGLHADRLAVLSGCSPEPRVVPFRGEYLVLKPHKRNLVRGNVYPVPDPRFPFLGFHFTPRMDGEVWLGPNAVLALRREGYTWSQFSLRDLGEALGYRGFRHLAWKHMSFGLKEMYRSLNMRSQVQLLQKFVPQLTVQDVERGPAGVRAQALAPDGSLVDDFVFDSGSGPLSARTLHVRNAPSPAATSSLAIAQMVADKAQDHFGL